MLIREIMTENVEFVSPDESVQKAAQKMRDFGVGPLPVCENQAVVGVLTDRDITIRAVAEGRNPELTKVRDVMSGELTCCFDDQEIDVAARLMKAQNIRRIVVMNRDKRLVGIVSLSDLAVEASSPARGGEILQGVACRCGSYDVRTCQTRNSPSVFKISPRGIDVPSSGTIGRTAATTSTIDAFLSNGMRRISSMWSNAREIAPSDATS